MALSRRQFLKLLGASAAAGLGAAGIDRLEAALMQTPNRTPIVIVPPPQGDVSRQAAVLLQDYLRRVTLTEAPLLPATADLPAKATVVVIGNADRNPVAGQAGFRQDWHGIRPDGYALRTLPRGARTFVVAAGCAEAGDKYAVYRLMREVGVRGRRVEFGDYDLLLSPFIGTREVIMGNSSPWDPFCRAAEVPAVQRARTYDNIYDTPACRLNVAGREPADGATTALRRVVDRYCLENWPLERLPAYITQMDAFGFNSLQLSDEWENYMMSGCLVSRRQWREKMLAMLQQSRALGNRSTLMTWGGKGWLLNGVRVVSDWDDPLCDEPVVFPKPETFTTPCWNDPAERQTIEAHLHYLGGYAPHIDHLISHYADPGGCSRNGCTLATAALLMNRQFEIFRGGNPRLRATFNTWPLTSNADGYRIDDPPSLPGWNGTFSWRHFTEVVPRLHPEIMVATRWYDPRVAECCRRWRRGYGIWDWYSSDQEITASLHVEAERLGRQFAGLPAAAADELDYYSLPSNCHGLNAASLYIAGQLLWTPRRDPFAILREFCDGVFGPRGAGAAYLGYEAIARIRNHDVRGDSAFDASYLGAGTPDPAADAERASAALAALRGAAPDPDWVAKIPLAVEVRAMYDDLVDHLTMVHEYARFRDALRKLPAGERSLPGQLRALPPVHRLRVSGGMIEYRHAARLLSRGD